MEKQILTDSKKSKDHRISPKAVFIFFTVVFALFFMMSYLRGLGYLFFPLEIDPAARETARQVFYAVEERPWSGEVIASSLKSIANAIERSPNDPYVLTAQAKLYWTMGELTPDDKSGGQLKALAFQLARKGAHIGRKDSLPQAYYGLMLYNKGENTSAWEEYQLAIALDPDFALPYFYVARAMSEAHNVKGLEKWLREAESKSTSTALYGRAEELHRSLANLQKNAPEVEASFLRQIARQNDNPWVRGNYAAYLFDHQRYIESIKYFQDALDIMEYDMARQGLVRAQQKIALPPLSNEYGVAVDDVTQNQHTVDNTAIPQGKSSVVKITETVLSPVDILKKYISAAADCDFTSRDTLLTNKSRLLLSRSCSAWQNEVQCYDTSRLSVSYKEDHAVVFRQPLSHNDMPPFMFIFQEGTWKIDFKLMSDSIVFGGSGRCAYPWSWRNNSLKNEVCDITKLVCETI